MSNNHVKDVKAWENGLKHWDFAEESYKANKDLCDGFGRDPFTFQPETRYTNNVYWRGKEGPLSHGYP